jgi:hypothetical protein
MLLENRNSVLEQELKNMGSTNAGEESVHMQVGNYTHCFNGRERRGGRRGVGGEE